MFNPICVNDYGSYVYKCSFTGVAVKAEDAIIIGGFIPGASGKYILAPTKEAKEAHKQSGIWFHESEANCNTCKHLERIKQEKDRAGFLYGRCKSKDASFQSNPYHNQRVGDVIMFHPHDPMHMPCYTSRFEDNQSR